MSVASVLVLGATGMVGSAVTRALVAKGLDVVVLVRSEAKAAKLELLGARAVLGDIRAPSTWKEELLSCRAVCHCAADWTDAAAADEQLLDWLLPRLEGKKLVYCGSCWLFGEGAITEASPMVRGTPLDWLIDGTMRVLQHDGVCGMVVMG
ncbi:unnamed protein product [Polarella glacialis]|uniref:NAD-dependent epimerase/dehydratase domain-containing protein n=1 Tax=Polarella glacialis TaxID=89957 RepID=A0A813LR20_POLGL|nr:unnamed protein product [Polarella glacialis]